MRRFLTLLLTLLLVTLCSSALADKTITITFTGDVTLGGEDFNRGYDTSFDSYYDMYGPEYFLANMKPFFEEDDLTIVNLEGVLSDNWELKPADKGKGTKIGASYWFRGRTEFVQVLTSASVEAVSLANNHAADYGIEGLRDTVDTLEKAGVEWFCTRDSNASDTERFFFFEKDGVTVAFISTYWLDYVNSTPNNKPSWLSQQIEELKTSGKADAVVCILHGGQEYGRHRTLPQKRFTRMAMNAGADLVITHHPHVVMGMDVIGNRSAFYSLGNFCFGGNHESYQTVYGKKAGVKDAVPALVVRAVLTFDDDGTYKGQQMTLYPVHTTGAAREGGRQANNYQPRFVTGPDAAHVLHLMQIDMNYDLKDAANKELKNYVIQKEKELDAMDSSDGMAVVALPYLPAK